MKHVPFNAPLAAALGLFLSAMAATVALADPPGYLFLDIQPSLNAADAWACLAGDPPTAASSQRDALTTAQQAEQVAFRALHQAQQAVQKAESR